MLRVNCKSGDTCSLLSLCFKISIYQSAVTKSCSHNLNEPRQGKIWKKIIRDWTYSKLKISAHIIFFGGSGVW
jgi:hypothetical protein